MTEQKHDDACGASRSNAVLERLAAEAGIYDGREGMWWGGLDTIARFAELVAAREREACAELLEQQHTWISAVAAANLVRERSNAEVTSRPSRAID